MCVCALLRTGILVPPPQAAGVGVEGARDGDRVARVHTDAWEDPRDGGHWVAGVGDGVGVLDGDRVASRPGAVALALVGEAVDGLGVGLSSVPGLDDNPHSGAQRQRVAGIVAGRNDTAGDSAVDGGASDGGGGLVQGV